MQKGDYKRLLNSTLFSLYPYFKTRICLAILLHSGVWTTPNHCNSWHLSTSVKGSMCVTFTVKKGNFTKSKLLLQKYSLLCLFFRLQARTTQQVVTSPGVAATWSRYNSAPRCDGSQLAPCDPRESRRVRKGVGGTSPDKRLKIRDSERVILERKNKM